MIGKPFSLNLKNGGNADMSVDGSGTPVAFTLDADPSADIDIHKLHLTAELGAALAAGNNFLISTISTLTNGLLIEGQMGGLAFTVANLKRTRDFFALGPWVVQAIGSNNALVHAPIYLPPGARICKQGTYPTNDFLKITVRDNLSALTQLEAFAQGTKL